MRACTIVARNYFPAARLLARSFLAQEPDSTFSILSLDATKSHVVDEGVEVLSPYDIGLDRREVHRMAMIYDVKELATAVKPYLLESLLARAGTDAAVYFDPDIEVYEPLGDVADLAREHGIVLTPHLRKPLPDDGLLPDDLMILQAGTYNLGFIAVGPSAAEFLTWWKAKLARDCLVAVDRGQFVDQRWIDLVPVLFEHVVLRDPACNVAYWNLHERTVRRSGDGYEVEGRPLRFFHFSGFDPRWPTQMSVHLGRWARIDLRDHPDVQRICRDYAARLLELGYRAHRHAPYRFGALPQGTPIDRHMRRLYRDALEAAERSGGAEPPDPFDGAAAASFVEWLNEPDGSRGISRYLEALYRARPDVQSRFPLVQSFDRDGFLKWVAISGRHEEAVPAELVPSVDLSAGAQLASSLSPRRIRLEQRLQAAAAKYPVLRTATPLYVSLQRARTRAAHLFGVTPAPGAGDLRLEVDADPAPGINLAGYLRAELGIGEIARKLVSAVDYSGLPYATITYGNTVSRQQVDFDERAPNSVPYDTNVVCINADQMHAFARDAGPAFFENRYTIGVWFWELETLPDSFLPAFELVDEVWVGSEFVQRAVASSTAKPVHVVPVPLEVPVVEPADRASLSLPDGFMFFFTFDFLSVVERKNPFGLLRAFKEAFAPGEGAALLIKSINGARNPAAVNRLRAEAAAHRDVHVLDGYLPAETNHRLMAACDCYVSLHRSEGLGLTMAEAMASGKPVIATGYSGNLTFMNEANSYLVPYTLVRVGSGAFPYPPDAHWADPDLTRAAELMRRVYEGQAEARARGLRARRELATRHSVERAAEFIVDRLDHVHGDRVVPARPRAVAPPA